MSKPNIQLLARVNEAYASAAYDCNGPAMLILGQLHRELIKISEGQGSLADCDTIRICQPLLSDS